MEREGVPDIGDVTAANDGGVTAKPHGLEHVNPPDKLFSQVDYSEVEVANEAGLGKQTTSGKVLDAKTIRQAESSNYF